MTPSDFAAQRSIMPQHVHNWFKRGIPLARLDETAELFCVNRRWLHFGEGPKYLSALMRPSVNCTPPAPPLPLLDDDQRMLHIPLHTVADNCLAPDGYHHLQLPAHSLEVLGVVPEHALCLRMPAANMAPLIPMDAIVAIDRAMTRVVDGHIYALLHHGQLKVHSLSRGHKNTLCLHSHFQSDYPSERYTHAQCRAQGLEIIGWVFHWSYFSQRPRS